MKSPSSLYQPARRRAFGILAAAASVAVFGSGSALAQAPYTINVVDVAGNLALTQEAFELYAKKNPGKVAKFVFTKGYIGIDGISLTVGEVRESEFCVNLIPETLARTNLGWVKAGWHTNIEIDPQTQAIVDTVERVLAARQLG